MEEAHIIGNVVQWSMTIQDARNPSSTGGSLGFSQDHQPLSTCPNCGHCLTCGRRDAQPFQPYQPYSPLFTTYWGGSILGQVTTGTTTITIS